MVSLLYVTWKGSLNILVSCFLATFFVKTWGCFKTFMKPGRSKLPRKKRLGILTTPKGFIVEFLPRALIWVWESWEPSPFTLILGEPHGQAVSFPSFMCFTSRKKIWKLKVMAFFPHIFPMFCFRGILKGKPRTLRSFKAAIFQPYPSSLLLLAALQQTQA